MNRWPPNKRRNQTRNLEEAEEAESLSGFAVTLVSRAIETVPPWLVLDALKL